MMPRDQLEARIKAIMALYRVNHVWVAGSTGKQTNYAVFKGVNTGRVRPHTVERVSETMTHKEAQEYRANLVAADIANLIEESRNHVHQE